MDGRRLMLIRGRPQRNQVKHRGVRAMIGMLPNVMQPGRVGGVGWVSEKKICVHPVRRPVPLEPMRDCMSVLLEKDGMMRHYRLPRNLIHSLLSVVVSVPRPVKMPAAVA